MKRTRILALLLAVVVMIMMAIVLLPQSTDEAPQEEAKKTVIVAKQPIPIYTEITAEMLEAVEYPESAVAPNAVLDLESAVGCTTLVEISAQEVLMSNHLLKADDIVGGLALLLEDGMRAMSVRVDDVTGVSNLLKVGNKVDVIVVLDAPKEEDEADDEDDDTQETEVVATMLLENIEIVALNTALIGNPVDDDGYPSYTTVTLAVTPQDAVSLAFACHEGTVYLIERPQNDDTLVDPTAVRVENIVG